MSLIRRLIPAHALILAALAVLGFTPRPAAAQNLLFTLDGVVFNDGAVATGSVTYDPSSQVFSDYNVTTTDGPTDRLTGFNYLPANSRPTAANGFRFDGAPLSSNRENYNLLDLNFFPIPTGPGVFPLIPGTLAAAGGFMGSGEFATLKLGTRVITAAASSSRPPRRRAPRPSPSPRTL